MTFSARTRVDGDANPLACALERAKCGGRTILDLTESNPTRARIGYAQDEIRDALASAPVSSYEPEPFGLRSAREAVAALWAACSLILRVIE